MCFGLMGLLLIGIPIKEISGWYDINLQLYDIYN